MKLVQNSPSCTRNPTWTSFPASWYSGRKSKDRLVYKYQYLTVVIFWGSVIRVLILLWPKKLWPLGIDIYTWTVQYIHFGREWCSTTLHVPIQQYGSANFCASSSLYRQTWHSHNGASAFSEKGELLLLLPREAADQPEKWRAYIKEERKKATAWVDKRRRHSVTTVWYSWILASDATLIFRAFQTSDRSLSSVPTSSSTYFRADVLFICDAGYYVAGRERHDLRALARVSGVGFAIVYTYSINHIVTADLQ